MRAIYKYPLNIEDYQTVMMPASAQILSVQVQHGVPRLWALVDPADPVAPYHIRIIGTGHPFDGNGQFLSTFQMHGGALVFHAFLVPPLPTAR